MICLFCRSRVLESGETWGYHHNSLPQFKRSLGEQCSLCKKLWDDLDLARLGRDLSSWFDGDASERAIYRWTLRKTASMRESQDVVVLRFRPSHSEWEHLPDRVFYFVPEEDLGRIPDHGDLGHGTNSDAAWSQMSNWMRNCLENHPKCKRKHSQQDFVPTRLLDVGSPKSKWPPDFCRVVLTKEEHIHGPYATLSHCWGREQFINLLDSNFIAFTTEGVPWKEIKTNKNFVDAIQVARNLNIRHIWIDSLCIIQQSKEAQTQEHLGKEEEGNFANQSNILQTKPSDFSKEGKLMHKVYRNSYCNIAAVASSDRNGGLFQTREPEDIHKILPARFIPTKDTVLFKRRAWRAVPDKVYEEGLLAEVLYTRGWVFQERMLSPRILHFSSQQMFWECSTITASEGIPSGLPLPIDAPVAAVDRQWRHRLQQSALSIRPIGDSSIEVFWRDAVRAYTSCNLTNQSDKLMAIWGVAKLVRDALGEDFGAGLWSKNLVEQLCWRVADHNATRSSALLDFPTWSWMSVQGEIEVAPRISTDARCFVVEAIDDKEPQLQLVTRLFSNTAGARPEQMWSEVLEDMEKKKAEMDKSWISKFNAKNQPAARLGRIAEQGSAEAPSAAENGRDMVQDQDAEKDSIWDEPPTLKSPEIKLKGHVVRRLMSRVPGTFDWALRLGADVELESIPAFPDTIPISDQKEVDFIILAASCSLKGQPLEKGQQVWLEEEELEMTKYTGVGILVERLDGNTYRRFGALKFQDLGYATWENLRRTCCFRSDPMGERDDAGCGGNEEETDIPEDVMNSGDIHGLDDGICIALR